MQNQSFICPLIPNLDLKGSTITKLQVDGIQSAGQNPIKTVRENFSPK